ncbi:MAG: MBL fold metallo-hydrolase [Clostridia bacterium]|nr:MBL fold metallo-hydrolase [Clostridia bacterium]
MGFEVNRVLPDVMHIRDAMGVCMTLIEGDQAALLVDTGYGVENVGDMVRSLIGNKPFRVLLTHHHHDHTLGAYTLRGIPDCECLMLPEDMPAFHIYNGKEKRRQILAAAQGRGLIGTDALSEATFLQGECELPQTAQPGDIDLGGVTVRIIDCPGHTPGSACVLIPERKLLLTGDDWNPCTWLFFPEALGVMAYRENIRRLQAYDFTHVLCSHQPELFPRNRFDDFVNNLTDAVLEAAKPVTIGGYEHIDTRQADITDGQILVFDWNKYRKE